MLKQGYFKWIALTAAFAGILFGYDTGVISGAILFIQHQFNLTPLQNGMLVSAVLLGALTGSFCSGRLTDYLGRKRVLYFVAILFIAGSIFCAYASTIQILLFSRILIGIAIGISSYTAPLYISEIAPEDKRGALVSLHQLMITVGILLSYIIDYHFSHAQNWRMMFLFGAIPAFILLLGVIFLPESPRFLIKQGKATLALATLEKIHGNNLLALQTLVAIEESIEKHSDNWRLLFSKSLRPVLFVGVGLAMLQQFTGINTIIYYAPTILQMAGFHNASTAILATMGVGIIFVLFTVFALPLIDSWGRRPLLLAGLSGMAFSLLSLSFVFSHVFLGNKLAVLALLGMFVFIASFAMSLGPIMWLMIAEIYPLKVRGVGASIATSANWGSNMLVAFTFLSLVNHVGVSAAFGVYFLMCLVGLVFVYKIVPETKQVSLETIEHNLYEGVGARLLGQ